MEIRQMKPEERAAYGRLCSLCFTYPYRDESAAVEAETEREQRQYRGAFDEQGRLCSGMIQLDMVCHFSGQEVKMLGNWRRGEPSGSPQLRRYPRAF